MNSPAPCARISLGDEPGAPVVPMATAEDPSVVNAPGVGARSVFPDVRGLRMDGEPPDGPPVP
jgi:hypothetical protein